MIVYHADKHQFLMDVDSNRIEEIIYERFQERLGQRTSEAERRSWRESMGYMHRILVDRDIPADCGVAVEFKLPQTNKRIDFIVTGLDADDRETAIIIELKQWSEVETTGMDGVVRTRFSGRMTETSHPSYQVWSYACLLRDFNEYVYTNDIRLAPCAYLHNFRGSAGILDAIYAPWIEKAPVFLSADASKLREFIKTHVRKGDQGRVVYEIENGAIRPSKQLADAVGAMLDGHPEFLMIDDQKIVFEKALRLQRETAREESTDFFGMTAEPEVRYSVSGDSEEKKHVLIVEGGPGTGKSVVAINLLGEFTRQRLLAHYVSKNAAPRAVYESKLTKSLRPSRYKNLFKGSGSYMTTAENQFDALIVDEAHRLNEKSGFYGTDGDHQIKEIIRSARFSVFFIDEDQRVTIKDIGTRQEIERFANELGAQVHDAVLASQFRCDGSDGYIAWLDSMLQIRETANEDLSDIRYDFHVYDDPVAMRDEIFRINRKANKARMVAGYCWDWVSKNHPERDDITLPGYDFSMKWNLASDGSLWIVSPESVNEIGCIHTCQGLEVDHVGVLIGPDLLVRDGKVLTFPDKRAKTDMSLKGWKSMLRMDPIATERRLRALIQNTYRTLMTRGMKGCFIWSEDEETREWFRGNK
jgi:DUF2075 family protein